MHPNQIFRKADRAKNIHFVRERSFGILTVATNSFPVISHVPFQLSPDGNYLEAHLVRSNPIVKLLQNPCEAVMVVSGDDAYISPDWYGLDMQVPTWNYIAVHLRGTLKLLDQNELRGVLERLSNSMENRLLPKPPWKIDKLDDETYSKLARQIVPVAMDISDIQGTWKLSQNKPEQAREGVRQALENAKSQSPASGMIAHMQNDDG